MPCVCVCFPMFGFTTAPQAISIRDGETKAHLPHCLRSNGGGVHQRQRWDESRGRIILRSISSQPECVVVLRSAGPQPINQTAFVLFDFHQQERSISRSYPHPFSRRRMKSLRFKSLSEPVTTGGVSKPTLFFIVMMSQIHSTALTKMKRSASFKSMQD